MATCSSILAWKIPWGHKESDTIEHLSAYNYLIPPCGWTAGYQIQCLPHRDGNSQISLPDLSFLRLLPFQLTVLSWSVQRPRHHPWINSFPLFSMSYPLPQASSSRIPLMTICKAPAITPITSFLILLLYFLCSWLSLPEIILRICVPSRNQNPCWSHEN